MTLVQSRRRSGSPEVGCRARADSGSGKRTTARSYYAGGTENHSAATSAYRGSGDSAPEISGERVAGCVFSECLLPTAGIRDLDRT